MKKILMLLSLCTLLATAAGAQVDTAKIPAIKKTPLTHLTFLLEGNNFYRVATNGKEKIKLDTIAAAAVLKLVEEAAAFNNIEKGAMNVIIQGDDVMSHKDFDALLDVLVKQHLHEVRIIVSG